MVVHFVEILENLASRANRDFFKLKLQKPKVASNGACSGTETLEGSVVLHTL